jgi:hypothetical protein
MSSYEETLASYKKHIDAIKAFVKILSEDHDARAANAPTQFMPEELIGRLEALLTTLKPEADGLYTDLTRIDSLTMAAIQLDDDDKKNIADVRVGNWVVSDDNKTLDFGVQTASQDKLSIRVAKMSLGGKDIVFMDPNLGGGYVYRPDKKAWIMTDQIGDAKAIEFHFRFLNPSADEWKLLRSNLEYAWLGDRKDGFDNIPISQSDLKMLSEIKVGYVPVKSGHQPLDWKQSWYQIAEITHGGQRLVMESEPTVLSSASRMIFPRIGSFYSIYVWNPRTKAWIHYSGHSLLNRNIERDIHLQFYSPPVASQTMERKALGLPPPPGECKASTPTRRAPSPPRSRVPPPPPTRGAPTTRRASAIPSPRRPR